MNMVKKQALLPKDGAKPIGPYSPVIQFGNLIFISGQIGFDPKLNALPEGIKAQTKAAMENLQSLLKTAGCGFKDILQVNAYLTDMAFFTEFNEVYASFLTEPYPARVTLAVKAIPKNSLVEIAAIVGKSE